MEFFKVYFEKKFKFIKKKFQSKWKPNDISMKFYKIIIWNRNWM